MSEPEQEPISLENDRKLGLETLGEEAVLVATDILLNGDDPEWNSDEELEDAAQTLQKYLRTVDAALMNRSLSHIRQRNQERK